MITNDTRYTDKELSLIKNTFAEKLEPFCLIRKVFYQMDLTEKEWIDLEKMKKNTELISLIRKTFMLEIDGDVPIMMIRDMWSTLPLSELSFVEALPRIKTTDLMIKYIEQQLKYFEGENVEDRIVFEKLTEIGEDEQTYINIFARNSVIKHVEEYLNVLRVLAGQANETPEETLKKLKANSNK